MDFSSFLGGSLPALRDNMTAAGANITGHGFHDGIFETLAPLLGGRLNPLMQAFMLLYNVTGSRLGLDPTGILTILGFIWAGNKVWRQLYGATYALVQEHLTASVHISSSDDMYLHLMKWLANQPYMVYSRSLTAETTTKSAWEVEEEAEFRTTKISADGSGIYLNFSNQEAKSPPRFVPAIGAHNFWFEGRYFRLHRKQESLYDDGASGGFPQFKDKEKLVITCYGRSPTPIKRLLEHAKKQYYDDHHAKTIVKRPSPQNMRKYGGRYNWTLVANRPVRPMKTVVLDAEQKVQVLADINEYLHPATPRWYANRGIPLRRGYLFHGPPGTGKTSLSFALAGVFGLDIYVISLLEPSLTEEDLSNLFSSLPRRCVVLLEDIDTAGLARAADEAEGGQGREKGAGRAEDDAEKKNKGGGGGEGGADGWKVADLARELKKHPNDPNEKKGISLSGLLNAIDGVASHEGRVLIMTTNKPESLDDALIRPGRVDLQVAFTHATGSQIAELFMRMYEAESELVSTQSAVALKQSAVALKQSAVALKQSAVALKQSAVDLEPQKQPAPTTDISQPNGSAGIQSQAGAPASKTGEDSQGEDEVQGDSRSARDRGLVGASEGLSGIAAAFASKVPDSQFSPAEIQGFLLKRKRNPQRALEEVDKWVEAMIQQKTSKTKVLQVQ